MPKRKSEKQLQSQLQLQQPVVVALSQLVDIEPFVDAGLVFDLVYVLHIFLDWTAADLARLCITCKWMRASAQLLILSHKQFRTAHLENSYREPTRVRATRPSGLVAIANCVPQSTQAGEA